MKRLIVLGIILFFGSCTVSNKGSSQNGKLKRVELKPDDRTMDPILPYDRRKCIWPTTGSTELEVKIQIISGQKSISFIDKLALPDDSLLDESEEIKPDFSSYVGKIINNKKGFKPIQKYFKYKVDWKKEKVIIIHESSTYKYGKLESSISFMGAAISTQKELVIGFRSTFHGVCQGIAQDLTSFSYKNNVLCLVIPKKVKSVKKHYCYFGPDCSNIP